jgi:hypothetical protein
MNPVNRGGDYPWNGIAARAGPVRKTALGFAAEEMASSGGALRCDPGVGQIRGDVVSRAQAATGAAVIEAPDRARAA